MATQPITPGGPTGPGPDHLTELPKGPKRPYQDVIILFLVVASGTLLFLALPSLIGAEGLFDWAKCAVLALAATAVAYGVNRLALDYGAPQAAIGTTGAAVLSVGSILLVGLATFFATYAGFTIEATRYVDAHLKLEPRLGLDLGEGDRTYREEVARLKADYARSQAGMKLRSAIEAREVDLWHQLSDRVDHAMAATNREQPGKDPQMSERLAPRFHRARDL